MKVFSFFLIGFSIQYSLAFDEIKIYPTPHNREAVESILWQKKDNILNCHRGYEFRRYKFSFIVQKLPARKDCCFASSTISDRIRFLKNELKVLLGLKKKEEAFQTYITNHVSEAVDGILKPDERKRILSCLKRDENLSYKVDLELPLPENLVIINIDLDKN